VANDTYQMPTAETRIPIRTDADIVTARQQGRALAQQVGFASTDLTIIATAISELGRNILSYAGSGEIILYSLHAGSQRGLMVVARDEGPGIPDIELAMQDAYSTSKSLGLGLPGTRRLMDDFDIVSVVGKGTTVTVKKWVAGAVPPIVRSYQ
jgi:serine/threonine-protein kinase RsbT